MKEKIKIAYIFLNFAVDFSFSCVYNKIEENRISFRIYKF